MVSNDIAKYPKHIEGTHTLNISFWDEDNILDQIYEKVWMYIYNVDLNFCTQIGTGRNILPNRDISN